MDCGLFFTDFVSFFYLFRMSLFVCLYLFVVHLVLYIGYVSLFMTFVLFTAYVSFVLTCFNFWGVFFCLYSFCFAWFYCFCALDLILFVLSCVAFVLFVLLYLFGLVFCFVSFSPKKRKGKSRGKSNPATCTAAIHKLIKNLSGKNKNSGLAVTTTEKQQRAEFWSGACGDQMQMTRRSFTSSCLFIEKKKQVYWMM